MKLAKVAVIALLLLALIGCASSPQRTQYYNFNQAPTQKVTNISTKKASKQVILRPLKLATFLDQQGLVIQLDEHKIYTSTYHRWAQPLQEILFNSLFQELNKSSSNSYSFTKKTPLSTDNADFQLYIDAEQFNSTNQAQVIFSGQFWVYDRNTKLVVHQPFLLTEKLTEDGYQHSVKKLHLTIIQLAEKINASLKVK